MAILAKLIGLIVFLMGIVNFINPKIAKSLMAYFQKGNRIYLAGAIRILFGVVLLLAAPDCRLILVIYVLGILIALAGSVIFIIKPEKIKAMLSKMSTKPDSFVRIMMIMAITIGALILYSV